MLAGSHALRLLRSPRPRTIYPHAAIPTSCQLAVWNKILSGEQMNRRNFLGLIPAAGAAFGASKAIAEDDPRNIKICHRINARQMTDDDLLFLKQIGLRYARL